MTTQNRFLDAELPAEPVWQPTRRGFLAALTSCSAALLYGTSSFGKAARRSTSLQTQVLALLKRLHREGLIHSGERTSWSVYDFTTRTKLVTINEDAPRQAASMIKPFVAQAFFFKVEESQGGLRYTRQVRRTMERMICKSNNRATNHLIELVSRHENNRGPRDVERVLKNHAPGIFRQTRIVEEIPRDGRTYRNLASAHDYSRFLYALWNERLPYADELRHLMGLPNRDRISYGVEAVPDSAAVYDKTGSTARLCGDMGIIAAPGRDGRTYPYTFVGIIERPSRAKNYGRWITRRSNAIRAVSNLVYLHMKDRHNLV
ncbi:MAG: serine hydrolase [Chromatiaceae bacterium]